ncbi:MAG: hypothetical protein DRQ78_08705 [Epsilonproteobacteria bacterium]|nr:MAG: hypothetical protein DRQ78_08705 [Campylobacterota bacterium]
MRVIYGNEIDTNVSDNVDPADVMETLKSNYRELSNASYNVSDESGESVMRVTLRSGSKA